MTLVHVRNYRQRREGDPKYEGRAKSDPWEGASDYEIEKAFADKILGGQAKLEDYPYFWSYVSTIEAEGALMDKPRKIAFVGSGPVPVSAILLAHRFPSADVDLFDIEPEALDIGTLVAGKVGVRLGRTIIQDITEPANLSGYNVVVLALEAPPGRRGKRAALKRVISEVDPGTLVLVRGGVTGKDGYVQSRDLVPRGAEIVGSVPIFDGLSETVVIRKKRRGRILGEGAAPRYRGGL
jgi:hypothetical protein